jgi:hypothetical protein
VLGEWRRSTTIRLVLVPCLLLSMPQQFAVLVNSWRGSSPDRCEAGGAATGSTASSSRTLPPFTSPTSNATWPPGAHHAVQLGERPAIACCHSGTVRAIVIGTAFGSMPQNQQRSQLSSAYCTTSRNGGEVTTSCTLCRERARRPGPVPHNSGLFASRSPDRGATAARTSASSAFDFFFRIERTSRGGGVWLRFSLILRCAATDTAWLGGSV